MNATVWSRVQEIVSHAADLDGDDRARWVATTCAGDLLLQQQVEEMLQAYSQAGDFFERAIQGAASYAASLREMGPGDRLGPYEITEVLGVGGMGTVYRAQRVDDQFQQNVAIKVVRAALGANEQLFARFRAERQILANINHPNIARLLDGGITENGLPFLVMEFIEGKTLDRFVADTQPSQAERLHLFSQICAAIQCAHQNLVVHRDLKPSNVIVGKDGIPRLLDFGIAKLLGPSQANFEAYTTRAVERILTPEYASPEQLRGGVITTATDIYGLGVLLYEMISGQRPFQLSALSPGEVETVVCTTQPPRPSLFYAKQSRFSRRRATDLDRITLKAMHREPGRRYASASALAADVQRYLEGFPVTARPDSFRYRSGRFLARHRAATSAVVLVFATVVALSVALAVQARHARREAQSADAVATFLSGLFTAARPDQMQGRNVSARELLDQGTRQLLADHAQSAAIRARLLTTVGTVYYTWGALDRADPLLSEAKVLWQREGKSGREGIAETTNVLGMLAMDRGNFARAEREDQESLRAVLATKGPKSEDAGDALNNLGSLAWKEGKFDEAERYLREAVETYTAVQGPESVAALNAKNNLGTVYADRGDYAHAEPIAHEVLRERLRMLGPNNPYVTYPMNNLAFVLDARGRLREAESLKRQTLALRQKLYGLQHPEVAQALCALGWTERELGNYDEALQLTTHAVEMSTKLQGADSADTAIDEDALGLLYVDMGKPADARPWLEAALQTRSNKASPSPMTLAQSYDHLGQLDLQQGHSEQALRDADNALKLQRAFYGVENDSVAQSLVHRSEALLALGRTDEAMRDAEQALRLQHAIFGSEPHPFTVKALLLRSAIASRLGDAGQAKAMLLAAKQMQQRLQAANP